MALFINKTHAFFFLSMFSYGRSGHYTYGFRNSILKSRCRCFDSAKCILVRLSDRQWWWFVRESDDKSMYTCAYIYMTKVWICDKILGIQNLWPIWTMSILSLPPSIPLTLGIRMIFCLAQICKRTEKLRLRYTRIYRRQWRCVKMFAIYMVKPNERAIQMRWDKNNNNKCHFIYKWSIFG